MKTMRCWPALMAALACATIPDTATAQSNWRDQVATLLGSVSMRQDMRSRGYTETHNRFIDMMGANSQKAVPVDLEAGRSYQLIGVCDTDCDDLDFRLYDETGTLVDSDVQDDDVPIVRVTPARAATFRLSVTMASCSTSSCGWGVAVFGTARGAAPAAGGEARITPIAPATAASGTPATSTASGTAWQDQVRTAIDGSGFVATARREGHTELQPAVYRLAAAGGTQAIEVDLQEGRSYRMIGKCDGDCSDLDLRLFDAQGRTVSADTATDDVPLLSFVAARSGRHLLQVTMAKCATSTCGWGVTMLVK